MIYHSALNTSHFALACHLGVKSEEKRKKSATKVTDFGFVYIANAPVLVKVRGAHTSEASIKVLTVKILFDFHELRSSLFERTVRLGSSVRNDKPM